MSKKIVSYSQLSMYNSCPHRWYLTYVKNLSKYESNIHLIFGSSIHTVLQSYLDVLYNKTLAEADEMDLEKMLIDELKKEFIKAKEKSGVSPCTKEEMIEFYNDGVEILRWFKKHKSDYFSKKGYELIGCEIPLEIDLNKNVTFSGFIDIVIKDKISNKILIKDFKTATRGWNDYQKKDENKIQQMVLYKKFYSDLYNVSMDDINIEYIILKRKLQENSYYPQKRVQTFVPPSGTVTTNKVMNKLNEFINNCFTEEGEYIDKKYYKNVSDSNCKYCEFNENTELCDKKN